MKKFIIENWFKLAVIFSFLIVAISFTYYFLVYLPNSQNKESAVNKRGGSASSNGEQQNFTKTNTPAPSPDLVSSFKCPEYYLTEQEKLDAIAKFISDYTKLFPTATVGEIYTARYHFLVSHSCAITLEKMLEDVQPSSQMLNFLGKDFGPQITEFSNDTKVWSSYFTLNGQGLDNPDEELIFNFYLENVWASKTISAEQVARGVADSFSQSDNSNVINKFTAPDAITKKPTYFIFSEIIYPDQNYAYLYIIKISPIQNSVFSVIYSKKFYGDATNLQNDINDWLVQDLKLDNGASKGISNIGVNNLWLDYFANNK